MSRCIITAMFILSTWMSCDGSQSCTPPTAPFPIAFGEIYTVGTVTQAVVTTPTLLTTFNSNGLSYLTIPNNVTDSITILSSGTYVVSLTISFEAATGRNWTFQVAVNGVAQPNLTIIEQSLGTTNDALSGATLGLLALTSGDIITVLVSQNGGATALEMEAANLTVFRIK